MNITAERRREIVQGLVEMAAFIDAMDPAVPLDSEVILKCSYGSVTDSAGVVHSLDSKEGMALIAHKVGNVDKSADSSFFRLRREFGPAVAIEWTAWRTSVCERVKVGTKLIPAQPAQEAQPERVEDVYEYRCPSLLQALPRPAVEVQPENAIPESGKMLALPAPADEEIPF